MLRHAARAAASSSPNFPYATLNPEGRSHLELTELELGKNMQAKIHACLGGEAFLIGHRSASR